MYFLRKTLLLRLLKSGKLLNSNFWSCLQNQFYQEPAVLILVIAALTSLCLGLWEMQLYIRKMNCKSDRIEWKSAFLLQSGVFKVFPVTSMTCCALVACETFWLPKHGRGWWSALGIALCTIWVICDWHTWRCFYKDWNCQKLLFRRPKVFAYLTSTKMTDSISFHVGMMPSSYKSHWL